MVNNDRPNNNNDNFYGAITRTNRLKGAVKTVLLLQVTAPNTVDVFSNEHISFQCRFKTIKNKQISKTVGAATYTFGYYEAPQTPLHCVSKNYTLFIFAITFLFVN